MGLLALLAIAGPRGYSREKIQAYLWPDSSAERARHALDQLLYATRTALKEDPFASAGNELRLDQSIVTSDLGEFENAIRRKSWTDAVALYGGPLLDAIHLSNTGELDAWIDSERRRLQLEYQKALETLARSAAAAGDLAGAVEWWRRATMSDPLSSRVATETVQALAAIGDYGAAIECAHTFQRLFRSELGLEPDAAFQRLVSGLAPKALNVPGQASHPRHKPAAHLTSVAVLPFVFLSDVDNSRALSLGFADALTTIFGNLEDVVVSPTSVILNYAAGADPGQVCRDLGVRHALQGTVQKLESRWRVTIQLFDSTTRKMTLSEKHDFTLDNMFEVQDEIGRRVVASLQTRFPLTVSRSRDRYSSNPDAYREFMAGLRESYSDRQETLRSAAEHLSRAAELDPEFALAHATLSFIAMQMHFHFDPQHAWLQRAEESCRRALELDSALPEGHLARAWILWSPAKSFQHAEAIAALERVLTARPNLERAHNRMSGICAHIGRLPESLIAHDRARLANPKTRTGNLEFYYLYNGELGLAEEAAEAWRRERPGNLFALYASTLPPLLSGNLELAERRVASALELAPGEPLIVTVQGMIHARRNETDRALQCVHDALDSPNSFGHTHHSYYQIACVYAVLGEKDKAMAWLERSVASGFACWPFFRSDPFLESMREEPVFKRLVAGLEQTYTSLEITRL
jgi:DNA-binding SARP family transcriptional activator/Tfp pilus assembly protein PilF